jgi:hypothetical protein
MLTALPIKTTLEARKAKDQFLRQYVVTSPDGSQRIIAFDFDPLYQKNVDGIFKRLDLNDCCFEKIPSGFEVPCVKFLQKG